MKKRKDGRYSASFTVGFADDGKRIRTTVYAKTKAELEVKKAMVMVDLEHGTYIRDKGMTFGRYAEKWLKKKSIEVYDPSMYEYVLRNYTKSLEWMPLTEITQDDCQQIINSAKDKPRTCQKIKLTLNQIFNSAIEANLLYKNPARGIALPKYKSSEKRGLTQSEKQILDTVVLTPREQMYVDLLRYYGLRKEEALALKKSDFDFDRETITIQHAVHFEKYKPIEKDTKNGKIRVLYIFPDHFYQFMAFILSCDDSDDHIFRNLKDNKWITEQSFRRMFESILKKMKQTAADNNLQFNEDLTSHIFRHGFATDLYYAGVGLKEAQYMLGHSTSRVTMDIYTHLEQQQMDVRDRLIDYHKKC